VAAMSVREKEGRNPLNAGNGGWPVEEF